MFFLKFRKYTADYSSVSGIYKTNMKTIEELKKEGSNLFDFMQRNLSATINSTDAELLSNPDPFEEMLGEVKDPESRREDARRTQDSLNRQGRESYTSAYVQTVLKQQSIV